MVVKNLVTLSVSYSDTRCTVYSICTIQYSILYSTVQYRGALRYSVNTFRVYKHSEPFRKTWKSLE